MKHCVRCPRCDAEIVADLDIDAVLNRTANEAEAMALTAVAYIMITKIRDDSLPTGVRESIQEAKVALEEIAYKLEVGE